ncbi:MAG: hypothetical protein Q9170_000857 [Blastenia crenularia]
MDPPRSESAGLRKAPAHGNMHSGLSSNSTSKQPQHLPMTALAGKSPLDSGITQRREENVRSVAVNDVLGQFSFAPATQTTVVTTTTTTTTSFPPLVIKAPRNVQDLDPALYPLSQLRTPDPLRKVQFRVGDRSAVFQEADDTITALNEWEQQQVALQSSKGSLRSVANTEPSVLTPPSSWADRGRPTGTSKEDYQQTRRNQLKRPLSPVSISEAVRLASQPRPHKRRHGASPSAIVRASQPEDADRGPPRSKVQRTSRSTPSQVLLRSHGSTAHPRLESQLQANGMEGEAEVQGSQGKMIGSTAEHSEPLTLSPNSEVPSASSFLKPTSGDYSSQAYMSLPTSGTTEDSDLPGAVTPVRTEDDVVQQPLPSEQGTRPVRPRPSVLDTTAAQDMSLPSPSLSPVTAALNLRNRTSYFEDDFREAHDESASFSETIRRGQEALSGATNTGRPIASQDRGLAPSVVDENIPEGSDSQPPTASMMNIPNMVDAFDAMPSEMQDFVMYQLLKRCSKPVLKFVADVVNPALKCNFLALLPIELSLQVISHLDVKSLCRAAQVSKKWRRIIDSDERAWKRLFDADGFTFPEGELQRAIREGWGWQNASRPDDWEQDLTVVGSAASDTEQSTYAYRAGTASLSPWEHASGDLAPPAAKRIKRKAASKGKGKSRRQQRREEARSVTPTPEFDPDTLLLAASGKEGPYAAAHAASIAVPYPGIGLRSLRNLHLFKSIYKRHSLIRKSWMQEATKPKHIAFRAHQRHVVTCLQFDTDKILTGSDDTNINVYDTQTGALRKKLAGHEGGVWALQYEGDVLVSGSTDRSVRVWDIPSGRCTQVFQGHTSTVRCLQILMPSEVGRTSDGRPIMMPKQPLIITGSRDSNLRVWKLPKPGDAEYFQAGPSLDDTDCPYFVRVLTGHHHSVRAIAAHADMLVSGSYDCTVRVWKISTGEMIHRLAGHTQKVYSVVLDHKRNRCISGSMDNMVKVWSLDTGSVLYNLEGHSSLVGLLDLKQDHLVSAAADSTLRIWDPETGLCKATLKAHTGAITCFQHDGQKVISGSDRTLKMWNVSNGKFVKDLLTDLSGVWQVNFNDRRCVAAVQRNGLTYIEVLDFGAARDGVPESQRGHRIVVDAYGHEMVDTHDIAVEVDAMVVEE